MKGVLLPDHIPLNKYELTIVGMPRFTFTQIDGLEEELEAVDLPDRTAASGGNTKPLEFKASLPLHHQIEQIAMENWFLSSQDPVAIDYKKQGTMLYRSISGLIVKSFLIVGIFPFKRKTGDVEMSNEGELHVIEWTFKGDRIIVL